MIKSIPSYLVWWNIIDEKNPRIAGLHNTHVYVPCVCTLETFINISCWKRDSNLVASLGCIKCFWIFRSIHNIRTHQSYFAVGGLLLNLSLSVSLSLFGKMYTNTVIRLSVLWKRAKRKFSAVSFASMSLPSLTVNYGFCPGFPGYSESIRVYTKYLRVLTLKSLDSQVFSFVFSPFFSQLVLSICCFRAVIKYEFWKKGSINKLIKVDIIQTLPLLHVIQLYLET